MTAADQAAGGRGQPLSGGRLQETIRKHLDTYKNKYAYDSVFLVSASTNNYYNFNGLDRNLVRGEDENVWYYNFLQSGEEYSLNIDNDEVAGAAIRSLCL